MRAYKTAAAAAMGLALVACGGGGGGGNDDTPQGPQAATADISSANYGDTADGAADATTSGLGNLALFTGGDVAAAASVGRATASGGSVQRLAVSKLLARSQAQDSDRARALAVFNETQACGGGGSLLLTINEADPATTTPGDSVTVTSQSCVEDGTPIVGAFKLTVSGYAETPTRVDVSFMLALNGFGVPELSFNGNVAVKLVDSADTFTVRLAHQGVTAVGAGVASVQWYHTVDYALDVDGETVSFSGFVGVDNGFVRLDQLSPFVLTTGQPSSGELQITGANGGRVIIVAGATGYEYEFYAAGNTGTTPDETTPGRAY